MGCGLLAAPPRHSCSESEAAGDSIAWDDAADGGGSLDSTSLADRRQRLRREITGAAMTKVAFDRICADEVLRLADLVDEAGRARPSGALS